MNRAKEGVLGRRGCHLIGEIEATLNPVESPIDIVEPLLKGGVIQFDAGNLALERAEPRNDLVKFAIDAVEGLVEPCETNAQKIEDVGGFAHT